MNPLIASVLAMLVPYVRKLGDEFLTRALQTLLDAVTGSVTDDQLIELLRERAKREAPK